MLAELASGSTHEKTIWEEVAQADAEVQCDDVYLLDMASWEAVKEEICQLERARNEQLMQELKEERERAASKHVESLAVEQGLRQELRAQEELLSESRTEEKILGDAAREVERAASKQVETLTLQRELKEEQRAFAHQREKLLHEERAAQKTPVEEHVARLTDELLDEQRAFAQQWETWLAKEERAASSMESVARLTSHALKEEQRGFASQREKLLHEEAELDLCRAAATKREELFRNELSAAQTQTAAERARAASAAAARHRVEEAQRLRTLGTPARAPSPAPSPARSPPIEPIAELKRSLSQQLPDKKPQPLPRRAHRSVGVPNGAIGLHRFGFDALRAEIAHAAAQHRSVLRRAATATAKPSPSRRLPRQLSVRPESSSSEELVFFRGKGKRMTKRELGLGVSYLARCTLIARWNQAAGSPRNRLAGLAVGSLYFSVLATCSGWLHYAQVLEGVMAQRTPMAQRLRALARPRAPEDTTLVLQEAVDGGGTPKLAEMDAMCAPDWVASPEGRVLPRNASHGSGSATAMVDNTGVDFPLDAEGKRSTTGLNQGAFAAAVEKHSAEAHEAVLKEKKWRFGYARHVLRQTQLAASKSDVALGIARDGLDYLHSSMQFCRDGGCSLKEAMAKFKEPRAPFWRCLTKAAFYGARPPPTHLRRFTRASDVYPPSGIRLSVAWASAASPQELDTAFALCNLIDRPEWLDLSDHTFVLFGAGSAMGPFPLLMQLGAHVVALDLPKPEIWKSLGVNRRLISVARRSPGKLTLPLHEKVDASDDAQLAAAAGCDLLRQTPEVRNWLLELGNSGKCGSMVLGAYCYADGPLFVRVSMAMDAIIADLVEGLKDRSRCWGSSWALRRWAWCLIG
eukprot:g30786.t1